MTEPDWLASATPVPMLEHIDSIYKTPAQRREMERKHWLFFMACMSSIVYALPEGQRRIYEVVRARSPYAQRVPVAAIADYTQEAATRAMDPTVERAKQAAILRCVFGNPFRPPSLNPIWLSRNDGMVARIAKTIYSKGSFKYLPLLIDALANAGCDNADILSHCVESVEHVRGCWVIDLLLGK